MFARVVMFASIAAVAGCDAGVSRVCTLIGCSSILSVDVIDAPLAGRDIDVSVTVNGQVVACSAGETGTCALADTDTGWVATVVLPSGDASSVALTVVEGAETLFDGEVGITWGEGVRPNGPDCEPVCYQDAVAQVNLAPPTP